MSEFEAIYKYIDDLIKKSSNIAIITHISPDGDTLGSATALCEVIMTNFKNKKVDIINKDSCGLFSFLPNSNKIIENFQLNKYDFVFIVDIATLKLSWFWENKKFIFGDKELINIDHHITNWFYGDVNLVDSSTPAASIVLYDFFKHMWYIITPDAATCLLTGIYTDTGAFAYSNVNKYSFEVTANLMEKWGDIWIIDREFFSSLNFKFLQLYSIILSRLVTKDNYAVSYMTSDDLEKIWCSVEFNWGLISPKLNHLSGVDYVIFLYQKWDGVKWSMRTNRDDFDLTKIASKFSWWWHCKASGFMIDWTLCDENWRIFVKKPDGELIYFS
ncbi:MAG: hypothetical protein ACD_49C00023G0017 [uncultured bacterium (gcode 4)]|uniref:DDH domain-containing protein n=1 Tax=uncultured bacterium (gcode 4) TaxID=1234023 RepID=K2BWY8_9BACT|nr:MAG: hypothetical protein ACD_49C00023G0017 [uncultured bacterium (gcode 4)]